jgi:hypothetical protein
VERSRGLLTVAVGGVKNQLQVSLLQNIDWLPPKNYRLCRAARHNSAIPSELERRVVAPVALGPGTVSKFPSCTRAGAFSPLPCHKRRPLPFQGRACDAEKLSGLF